MKLRGAPQAKLRCKGVHAGRKKFTLASQLLNKNEVQRWPGSTKKFTLTHFCLNTEMRCKGGQAPRKKLTLTHICFTQKWGAKVARLNEKNSHWHTKRGARVARLSEKGQIDTQLLNTKKGCKGGQAQRKKFTLIHIFYTQKTCFSNQKLAS